MISLCQILHEEKCQFSPKLDKKAIVNSPVTERKVS